VEAYLYAHELNRSVWDFAVEIGVLRQVGCTNSEFRWLVCKGYVDHAPENTLTGEETRSFRHGRQTPGLTFGRRTGFVLTDAGFEFAIAALGAAGTESPPQHSGHTCGEAQGTGLLPEWDPMRQELRVGGLVIKQFKVPAANQERVLAAFQEDGWPPQIDDPLPPISDQDPKRRLHDTINSLNRNQKHRLVRFEGDGTGQGIRWQLISTGVNGKPTNGHLRPNR
jgi:hypothetical protein